MPKYVSHFTNELCNNRIIKHFLWYRVGIASSDRLRNMEPGSLLLQKKYKIYNHVSSKQMSKIRQITRRLQESGSHLSGINLLCHTVLGECQTDRQLCKFTFVFLTIMVDMLEQTEQVLLNKYAETLAFILCSALQNNIQCRERQFMRRIIGVTVTVITLGICVASQLVI